MAKGLVLAGGGAKGSYQVGVYKALEELGWQPGVITGTSVGCLNGAMFATGQWAVAHDMWLSIDTRHVITDPPAPRPGNPVLNLLQDVAVNGGMDVTPLENIVKRVLSEQALRNAPVRFGLVTVNKRTLKPLEVSMEEIPEGQAADYLLASAACFPAFEPRAIGEEEYIDGGYSDNMPIQLAVELGADEVVAVDVDGIGIVRKAPEGIPITYVRSYWDLGAILTFDPMQAAYNMTLGYNDCYRAFGKLLGSAYSIRAGQEQALAQGFARLYAALLKQAIGENPTLAFTEQAAFGGMDKAADTDAKRVLLPLERACELAGVDPLPIYTAQELFSAFLQKVDLQLVERFSPLFCPDAGICLKESAQAAAAPGDFLQALVYRSLTSEKEGEKE